MPLLSADVEMVHVQKKFQKIKKEHQLIVAFAYSLPTQERLQLSTDTGKNIYSKWWNEVNKVVSILESFSNRRLYTDDVIFVAMNFDRGDMAALRNELSLTHDALLFFKDGVPVLTQIIDVASFTPADMRRFLERSNVADFAEYAAEERIAKKEREREYRRRATRPVFSLGIGLGYGSVYPWCSGCVSPWVWGGRFGYWSGCC
jgi:hypothetical protein